MTAFAFDITLGAFALCFLGLVVFFFSIQKKSSTCIRLQTALFDNLTQLKETLLKEFHQKECHEIERLGSHTHQLERRLNEHNESLWKRLSQHNQNIQETLRQGIIDTQRQVSDTLMRHTQEISKCVENLSQTTDNRLKEINKQVENRLSEGFEKTTATFTDIVKRLALIDDAQQKLSALSSNVVSLQAVLADKRSRGAFGEIQLKNLIHNMLPQENYAFQHTLSNGLRADCLLFLPEPTGNIVIDSKFPLENFQKMTDFESSDQERKQAQQLFRQDIKKHIQDIATKYIIKGETSEGALMFIPAEAVFAEIHGHFPDLVEFSYRSSVWLASPTTMMAILTTASAVLKDTATKQHIHIIQEHLRYLAEDFSRFDERMNKLAKHIDQAQEDVKQVHHSAKKISKRFTQIEKVEKLESPELAIDGIL